MNQLPSGNFEEQFYARLDKFPSGRRTLKQLEGLGCDPTFLLMFVELYCGLNLAQKKGRPAQGAKGFVLDKRSLAATIRKFSGRLLKDATEIERLNLVPELYGALSRRTWVPIDLPNQIRSYASVLNSASDELDSRWSRALRTEPGKAVRLLTEYVKSTTGEKRYGDLALLLSVGYLAHGINKNLTVVEVRKIATRAGIRQRSSE